MTVVMRTVSIIVEIKFQQMVIEESQPTREAKSNEESAEEQQQPVDTMPDIVRSVEQCLSGETRFVVEDVGEDVGATWSGQAMSPVSTPTSSELPGVWNSNDKVSVTINQTYRNESFSSSRSSLVSSVDDACCDRQSSVAEPIDLSDSEHTSGGDMTGILKLAGSIVEQVIVQSLHHVQHTLPRTVEVQKEDVQDVSQQLRSAADGHSAEAEEILNGGTGDAGQRSSVLEQNIVNDEDQDQEVLTADFNNNERAEILREEMPPVCTSSERSCTTGEEALQELDAYLTRAEENQHGVDDDSIHASVANASATSDVDTATNSFGSEDRVEIVDTVSPSVDLGEDDQRYEVDQEQIELTAEQVLNVDEAAGGGDIGQLDDDDDVNKDTNHRVDDFTTNETAKRPHDDGFKTIPDTVETSANDSPSELVDATASALNNESSVASLSGQVDDGVIEADAEVNAIFSGEVDTMLGYLDRCYIRCVTDDEVPAADPDETDLRVQSSSQASYSSDTDEAVETGVTSSLMAEHPQPSPVTMQTPDNVNDECGVNSVDLEAHVCASELPIKDSQFDGNRPTDGNEAVEGQDIHQQSIDGGRLQQDWLDRYVTDECGSENGGTSSDLEISVPVEPSDVVLEVLDDDDVDDVKPRAAEESQTITPASPGSNSSWRLSDADIAARDTKLESASSLRGITASQIFDYSKFCSDRLNKTTFCESPTTDTEKTPNGSDVEDRNTLFAFVDAVELPPSEYFDAEQSECHHSESFQSGDCRGTDNGNQQSTAAEVTLEDNETMAEDADEIAECDDADTADEYIDAVDQYEGIDTTLTTYD